MRYEIAQGGDVCHVEIREVGAHVYDVTIDDGETVRIDAFKTARTVYSVLIDGAQYEGSVDERDDGTLDVHVGTSAFDFTAVDERKKLLSGIGSAVASGQQRIAAQMPGKIVRILVRPGDRVEIDQSLLIMEAMKMENEIKTPIEGIVSEITVAEGDAVETGELLIVVDPPDPEE